jgi:translocation and assembly module TamB
VAIPEMGQGLAKGRFRLEPGGFSVEGDVDVSNLSLLGYRLARAKGPAWCAGKGELSIKASATTVGRRRDGRAGRAGRQPKAEFEGARHQGRPLPDPLGQDHRAPNLVVTGEGERGILGGLTFKGDARVASWRPSGPARGQADGALVGQQLHRQALDASLSTPRARAIRHRPFGDRSPARRTPRLTGKGAWNNGVLSVADAKLDGANANRSAPRA